MARHRFIRSLDADEEYVDFISCHEDFEEDSSSSSPRSGTNEITCSPLRVRNYDLSDFIVSPVPSKGKGESSVETTNSVDVPFPVIPEALCRNKLDESDTRSDELEHIDDNRLTVKKKLIFSDSPEFERHASNAKIPALCDSVLESAIEFYNQRSADNKSLINLVVIGHVDAGKSTMMGNMLAMLGCVTEKTVSNYKREAEKTGKSSFAYAWVFDETNEERKRGITMDVSQRKFETTRNSVIVLDTPGHKDFISNMISGAAEADAAVLVVDSSVGKFEAGFNDGGQTKEHLLLAKSLGISQLIVAVNKMDCVSWKQMRYQEIISEMLPYLKKIGFEKVEFIPCSGLLGLNLVKSSDVLELCEWYSGLTLLEAIDQLHPPERLIRKPLRLPASNIFKANCGGSSLTGRIASGSIKVNDKVIIMPEKHVCSVSKVILKDLSSKYGFAGDQVELQLSGVDQSVISMGSVICSTKYPISVTSRFRAKIVVFDVSVPITKGFPVTLHRHSYYEQAVISKLVSLLHRNNGEVLKKHPRFLTKNVCADVEINIANPTCFELYKDIKALGRFLLRSKGVTIAAGMITELLQ